MLLIGKSEKDGAFLVIRHLPVPDRKNLNTASGPVLRFSSDEFAARCEAVFTEHFDQFRRRFPPSQSELEMMSAKERANLFASHRFVDAWERASELLMTPSDLICAAPLDLRFFPVEDAERLERPWTSQSIWQTLNQALARSSNRVLDR